MTSAPDPMPFTAHVEAFDLHCRFEERAAILEYDGGFSRLVAEGLARAEVYGDGPAFDPGRQS